MSAPKTPDKASLAAALDAPPPELTPAEKRLLNSFRLTDNRGRQTLERMALKHAQLWPQHTGPSLKLITGGVDSDAG